MGKGGTCTVLLLEVPGMVSWLEEEWALCSCD